MLASEAKPYSKAEQLARGEKRYRRKVASAKQWQRICAAKLDRCRICHTRRAERPDIVLDPHHLVARIHGGDDVEANIVPLCRGCHDSVTRRWPAACLLLLESLDDFEYGYMIRRGGPDYAQRAYGVEYVR